MSYVARACRWAAGVSGAFVCADVVGSLRGGREKFAAVFGIVYDGYSRQSTLTTAWEAISMLRKTLLVLIPFVTPQSMVQTMLANVVAAVRPCAENCVVLRSRLTHARLLSSPCSGLLVPFF